MNRRIVTFAVALLALVALACKGTGTDPAGGSPTPSAKPRPVLPNSMAALGASITAADLPGQATQAVTLRPDYVTILIGANDACGPSIEDMTTTADFDTQLRAALHTLKSGLPKARILVVSIPDVYRVWEVAHTRPEA